MNKTTIRCLAIAGTGVLFSCGNKSGSEGDETKLGDVAVEGRACAEGETPLRDGCTLPCTDGWHEGPDGGCVVDCPPMMTEQEDGSCALSCGDDEEEEMAVRAGTDTLHLKYCDRGCPEGMELIDGSCELPCGEGWNRDADGACHLRCPEGMVAADDENGCAFETVGENKICPAEKWDTSVDGPFPLFVDPVDGAENGDGTRTAPFATIQQAVQAMGDEATIYLASGEYDEQVIVDGKAEVNLIGQCASNVVIAPSDAVSQYPEGEQGRYAGILSTWRVDRVHIHGVTVRSPLSDGDAIVIRHDSSPGSQRTVVVDQVVVDQAGMSGVLVNGAYEQISVTDATLVDGQAGIYIAVQSEDEAVLAGETLPMGTVEVRRNRIEGLTTFDDTWNVMGLSVVAADRVVVAKNRISNLTHASGMEFIVDSGLSIEKNILSDISGHGGIWIKSTFQERTPTTVDIRDNIIRNISAAPCAELFCTHITYGIDLDAINSIGPFDATASRNRIEGVQGHAVSLGSADVTGNRLVVSDSELIGSTNGIEWLSGDLSVEGCRFSGMWRSISSESDPRYQPLGALGLERNLFEAREEDPAGTPSDVFDNAFVEAIVYMGLLDRTGDVMVIGNVFRNNEQFETDRGLVVLNLAGDEVRIEANRFENNQGAAAWIGSGSVTAEDNQFLDNDSGLRIEQTPGERIDLLEVRGNAFLSTGEGLYAAWPEETGEYAIEDNVFVNSMVTLGDLGSVGQNAERLRISDNYFGAVLAQAGLAEALDIDGNRFEESRLVVFAQPEGSTADITGNLFDRSHLEVFRAENTVRIEDNELNGPGSVSGLGVGIGVYESVGPIQIIHNLIRGYGEEEVPGVGIMGDGIQIAGENSGTPTQIWIASNRLESNGRFGAVALRAEGWVEGNSYPAVEGGRSSDLVLELPRGAGYDGADVEFATPAESLPAVLAPENILSGLR